MYQIDPIHNISIVLIMFNVIQSLYDDKNIKSKNSEILKWLVYDDK
jgi:hypothetical protein